MSIWPACPSPACAAQAIGHHLFTEQNFRVPPFRRSNIPSGVLVDHPGVYENAKYGYLHEALISRQGIPAVLAILLEQICQQLLTSGAIDFAVRVDCSALDRCRSPACTRHHYIRPAHSLTCCATVVLSVRLCVYLMEEGFPFLSNLQESSEGFSCAGSRLRQRCQG